MTTIWTPNNRCYTLIIVFTIVIILSFSGSPFAQPTQLEISSSFNPVGSGARAIGMGGAFIAVCDDATAASWNPGGLFQVERPEVSFVANTFRRTEKNKFGTNPEASGSQDISNEDINYLSILYPFNLFRRNMSLSLSYQHLYDFTRKWNFSLSDTSVDYSVNQDIHYKQDGGLSALGIAYSLQITPTFSLGLTLNIWDENLFDNEWKQNTFQAGSGTLLTNPFSFETRRFDKYSFKGFSGNIGTCFQLFDNKLAIGAVLKTPFRADLRHETRIERTMTYGGSEIEDPPYLSVKDEKLDMPISYGIGFAFRFSHKFISSLDIFKTEWGKFVLIREDGEKRSPISGHPHSESEVDSTYQIRMGCEYFILAQRYSIPLRAGIFYDPAPSEGNPDDYYGFSLGLGIKTGKTDLDMAYQYRTGKNVSKYILSYLDFSQDIEEHTVYLSMIYHFGGKYIFED